MQKQQQQRKEYLEMRLKVKGKIYYTVRNKVENKLFNIEPEAGGKYFVKILDKQYPIKQVVGKVFSLSRAEFITQEAYRILKNLGFEILNIEEKEKESEGIFDGRQKETNLFYAVTHNGLTGLPNRSLFNNRLTQILHNAKHKRLRFCVMMLNLDNFEEIKKSLGYKIGDKLLPAITSRLRNIIHLSDTITHSGKNVVLLLLLEINKIKDGINVAQRILGAFREPFLINNHKLNITINLGFATYPNNGEDANTLISRAGIAMYHAKQKGQNNYQHYTPDINNNDLK